MKASPATVEDYLAQLPVERREVMEKLRRIILENLPKGFEETIIYGMIGYVVPHSLYPAGYHVNPELPLPFVNLASQKNYISLYHMGLYALPELLNWFEKEYDKQNTRPLDMGKSCIRFKKTDHIPYDLIGQLMRKMSVADWIDIYGKSRKKRKNQYNREDHK